MIYSFVNLISWSHFENEHSFFNRMLYADSISMKIIIYLVTGKKITVISGVDYYLNIDSESNSSFFLVAHSNFAKKNSYVLPFFRDLSKSELNVIDWRIIEPYSNIFIGISSPKQERLAEFLQTKYPEKDFYCFGAALYVNKESFYRSKVKFLLFLIHDTRRTINKFGLTVYNALRILLCRRERLLFKEFVAINFTAQ